MDGYGGKDGGQGASEKVKISLRFLNFLYLGDRCKLRKGNGEKERIKKKKNTYDPPPH